MFMQIIEMLYYDRIDVSERTNVKWTTESKAVMFVTISISKIILLSFNQMSAINVMIF